MSSKSSPINDFTVLTAFKLYSAKPPATAYDYYIFFYEVYITTAKHIAPKDVIGSAEVVTNENSHPLV